MLPTVVQCQLQFQYMCMQTLLLDHNRLTDVPPAVCELPQLETLVLSGNAVAEVPAAVSQLTALSQLKLEPQPAGGAAAGAGPVPEPAGAGRVQQPPDGCRGRMLSMVAGPNLLSDYACREETCMTSWCCTCRHCQRSWGC